MNGEPKLSQFGEAFAWLLQKEVSSSRLASLFDTTAENVRVIAFRARHAISPIDLEASLLTESPGSDAARVLGIRPPLEEVADLPTRPGDLDFLRSAIDSVVAGSRERYTFGDGIRLLRRIAPRIGYASDPRRIALRAGLHQHTAWFHVHQGHSVSAAAEAQRARELWRFAYHQSPRKEYAAEFVKAALIGSQACLLARRPNAALPILDVARDAAEAVNAPIGSDHFRQHGVALLQLREDERAGREFRTSAEVMDRLGEGTPAKVAMTGIRHTNLLNGDWDRAYELLTTVRESLGEDSLPCTMAAHWAVACGVSTDSVSVTDEAVELLRALPPPSLQFGHQMTIRKLLAITPELGLGPRLLRAWVRRALYENTFRNR